MTEDEGQGVCLAQRAPSPHASRITHHASRSLTAFTLLEVMIACGIFFMATFAILALVANTLRNARGLQRGTVDAGMAAAQVFQLFKTNKDPDLYVSGDFGDAFRDYRWEAQSTEFDTNGLLQVDIVVSRRGSRDPVDTLQILVYQPDAKNTGPGGVGSFRR
jgi:type II secretory pathway pseudopilin PulG